MAKIFQTLENCGVVKDLRQHFESYFLFTTYCKTHP